MSVVHFDPFVPIIDVDVATFDDAEPDKPLVKLNAAITPVQDLHGYNNPWPAGGGKNMVGLNSSPYKNAVYSHCTASEHTDYSVKLTSDGSTYAQMRLFYQFKAGTYTVKFQATSSDSYTPSLVIYQDITNTVLVSNIQPNTERTFTFTEPKDVYLAFFASTSDTTVRTVTFYECQLESGSSATAFTPYANICPITGFTGADAMVSPTLDAEDATVYPIDWTDDAGTVYKGYINFTTGELTATHEIKDLGSFEWTKNSDFGGAPTFYFAAPADMKPADNNVASDMISDAYASYSSTYLFNNPTVSGMAATASGYINFRDPARSSETAADFKTAVTGQKLVYELATPLTYELDPVEVKTLEEEGTNNVWVSTGKIIELYYPIDISYFRRYFMVNSGYILLDGGDIDLTSTDPQLIVGSWDRIVTAMETGKPIWAFNTKYGTGKPLSPVPVFAWYLSATSIVIVGATLHIIVSNTDYCVVQDVASA